MECDKPTEPAQPPALVVRPPRVEDGWRMWRLVRDAQRLDLNSCYAYLLLCRDFSATCRLAEQAGELLGFVTAYLPPARRRVVFVWQIAVAPAARRQGLALRLLEALLDSPACAQVRYLEATVTDSNTASRRLFQRLAGARRAGCQVGGCFAEGDFGDTGHEAEELFRIGPFNEENK